MNFGSYAVLTPVTHEFEKEPTWSWTIKPIDMGAELAMSQFVSRDRYVVFPDGARAVRQITTEEIALREVALTFQSTTIPSDDGKPVLAEGASVPEVEAVLMTMPPSMVRELWNAVGQACPPWGPVLPGKDTGEIKKAPSTKK
jgi:hypothetical protein